MAQTISTTLLLAGKKQIMVEKPQILCRLFFSVRVIAGQTQWYDVKMSFDDPQFRSFYSLNGPEKYFEAEGADIFQGNVWVYNNTDTDLLITATEILSNLY